MFNVTKIFPLILIILDFGAGVVYACQGDIKKMYILDCGGSA